MRSRTHVTMHTTLIWEWKSTARYAITKLFTKATVYGCETSYIGTTYNAGTWMVT